MPWLVFFSKDGLWDKSQNIPYEQMPNVIKQLAEQGHCCALISNQKEEPPWLEAFSSPNFQFLSVPGRAKKNKVRELLQGSQFDLSKILVISCTNDDFYMAINSKLLFLMGGWSQGKVDPKKSQYGVKLNSPLHLPGAINLLSTTQPWYYKYQGEGFSICSMTNAGDHNSINEIKPIVGQLRNHLKHGDDTHKVIFNLLFISSLMQTPSCENIDYWAYYPSSNIKEKEHEIVSSYAEIARVSLSCKKQHPHPILVRHKRVPPRHSAHSGDRVNPNPQIQSIHIHDYYQNKLNNKTVAVIDDFTTYGTSFGVAEALLKKAGARNVICFALGKFGSTTHKYDIDIEGINPFGLIETPCQYSVEKITNAHIEHQALNDLVNRIEQL